MSVFSNFDWNLEEISKKFTMNNCSVEILNIPFYKLVLKFGGPVGRYFWSELLL